jgi:tellurite resistance protein TehA-like permease
MGHFPVNALAKMLIIFGGIIVIVGVVMLAAGKTSFLGKLPGDINIKGKSFSIYVPIVTCIVVSVILTLIVNLIFRK